MQRGRAIYFAGEIGKLAWRFRLPDHTRLIANAVRAVTPRPFPADLAGGPFGVQLSLFRQRSPARLFCHLVNGCGAGTVRHDVLPVRDLRLRLTGWGTGGAWGPPGGAGEIGPPRRARALALDWDLEVVDGVVTVPELRTWEIVVVES